VDVGALLFGALGRLQTGTPRINDRLGGQATLTQRVLVFRGDIRIFDDYSPSAPAPGPVMTAAPGVRVFKNVMKKTIPLS
jgi:hypothetical protein